MRRVLEALGSGFVVYAVMAACSAGGGSSSSTVGGSAGAVAGGSGAVAGIASGGVAGVTGAGGSGGLLDATEDALDAVADALTDPVPDATANESGTRLRARRLVATDGAKHFYGWRDTLRNEDCYFQVAYDGKQRCMPSGVALNVFFTDAACTQPIGGTPQVPACMPKSTTGYKYFTGACGMTTGLAVYTIGQEVAVPAEVYQLGQTSCVKQTATPTYKYFALTAVAPSEFVEATEKVD